MSADRKRKVNPALLLGGGESERDNSSGLVESGDFAVPRKVRNFLPSSSPVSGEEEEVVPVDDEPSLDELEGLGLGRVSRRRGDAVDNSGGTAPVDFSSDVATPVDDEPSMDELEGLGLAPAGRVRSRSEMSPIGNSLPEEVSDEVDAVIPVSEPSVDELEGLGLAPAGRRERVVPDVPLSEVAEVVLPELKIVEEVTVDDDVKVDSEPSEPVVSPVRKQRKVNPLFLTDVERPEPKREDAKPKRVEDKVDDVKSAPVRERRVNPAFMLDKDVKPTGRPSFLDTGRAPSRKPVSDASDGGQVVSRPSEEDRVRQLFVTRSDAKPRSPYTKRVDAGVEGEEWDEDSEGVSAGLGGEVDTGKRKADHKGFHFRERDAIMLRFLARYRYAYVDQIARLVDSTPRNVMARLRVLEKRGFIRRESVTGTQYLWTTRKAGNLLVDIGFKEIKKGNISYATISHTIGLANLGVEFERENGGKDLLGEGKGVEGWEPNRNRWWMGVWGHPNGKGFGEMTVTEREIRQGQTRWRGNRDTGEMRNLVMRAIDNPSGPECEEGNEGLFVVYGLQGGEHVPDFVIARERNAAGGVENIAIELELTEKTNAEWRKIVRNYRDNGQMFKKVYYFTHKKAIANALRKIIEMEGMEDRIILRKYVPTSEGRLPFWG